MKLTKCHHCERELPRDKFSFKAYVCNECKEKQKEKRNEEKPIRFCRKCHKPFDLDNTRQFVCDECNPQKLERKCSRCKRILLNENFESRSPFCIECKTEIRERKESKIKIHVCKKCGNEFEKEKGSNKSYCPNCKETSKIKEPKPSECNVCHRILSRDNFPKGNFQICNECREAKETQKNSNTHIGHCKSCNKEVEVPKMMTFFYCDECKEKMENDELEQRSKNICKTCGEEFEKDPSSRIYYCNECMQKVKEKKLNRTTCCIRCKEEKLRKDFDGVDCVCRDCKNKEKEEKEFNQEHRRCTRCNEVKLIGPEIKKTSFFCFDCIKEKDKEWRESNKKKIVVRECIGCKTKITIIDNPRATVIYCEKCKAKKDAIETETKLRKMNRKIYRHCYICGTCEEVLDINTPTTWTCDNCKINPVFEKEYVRHCMFCESEIITKNKLSTFLVCETCKSKKINRIRIKNGKKVRTCHKCKDEFEIVGEERICIECSEKQRKEKERKPSTHKKHFGYYGTSSDGHKWDSLNEQDVEEWLIHNNIQHTPHPRLGDTLKRADQYLPEHDLYLEIDGIGRTSDVEWYGKLSLYKKLNLNFKILPFLSTTHFRENRGKCFEELDDKFSFLKKEQVV
jgi:hypothetical protein